MNFSIRLSGQQDSDTWLQHTQLALACEGGGQRGIFTAGILDTFLENDFFPFRTLVGTSAGAQNLSAYASGSRGYARRIILRYTTQKPFFDPLRFARGGHLIDLDWLFDTTSTAFPLDAERAARRLQGRELRVVACRSDTLAADYLPFAPATWAASVKASSAIPLFYRGGVSIGAANYWDGGVSDPLPLCAAHRMGADCIVVIRTLPASYAVKPLKLPPRLMKGRLSNLAAVLQSHLDGYLLAHDFIARPPTGVKVIELAPRQPLKSQLVGSKLEALRHDYRLGQACAQQFLDQHAWRLRRQAPTK
jgi:predicted patatin/cPLA2 family phospholipase